jgi:hypothetical protein
MNTPDRHGQLHSPAALDWWPGEVRLSAIVRRSLVTLKTIERLKQGETKYREFALRNENQVREGYGDYVFDELLNSPGESDSMLFLWSKPIVDAEHPSQFRSELLNEENDMEEYSWPPICSDLRIILDKSGVKQAGFQLDLRAAVERGLWQNGQSVPCRVLRREYVSTMRVPASVLDFEVPMPTEIRGDYFGQPIRLPACLHPRIELTSLNSSDALIHDLTPTRSGLRGMGERMVLGATNFQTWAAHVFERRLMNPGSKQVHRRWIEKTVFPPPIPPQSYA